VRGAAAVNDGYAPLNYGQSWRHPIGGGTETSPATYRGAIPISACAFPEFRNPKIRKVGCTVAIHQNVARFEVTMHNTAFMGIIQRTGDLR
jgi:hypothetical protein